MAELITENGRKAIKKIAEVSQCARVLSLMPTAEDFALRLIGELRKISDMINTISMRIDGILERYSSIPTEFLLKGFDEILEKLDNINDYAKFAISETMDVMSSTVKSAQELTDAVNLATSTITSATLQIGGGLTYGTVAMGANISLALNGGRRKITNDVVQDAIDGKISVSEMEGEIDKRVNNGYIVTINDNDYDLDKTANSIRKGTKEAVENSTKDIDNFFGNGTKNSNNGIDGFFSTDKNAKNGLDKAQDWISEQKNAGDDFVDGTVGELTKKVENAKKQVEEKIESVKTAFENITKKFDEAFGFVNGGKAAEELVRHVSNTAYEMDTPIYDAIGDVSEDMANFIANFSIGKVITAFGGLVVGIGAATVAMDLLPNIDVDKMLKEVIGGYDSYRVDKMTELYNNKYYEDAPDGIVDLCDVPDSPWKLSMDDIDKYNDDGYKEYINKFNDGNEIERTEILEQMHIFDEALSDLEENKDKYDKEVYKAFRNTYQDRIKNLVKENRQLKKENKSALKAMRKVRRDTIKAKQIERYKSLLNTELEYLKKECTIVKDNLKNEWDLMMSQYQAAIDEIKKFFSKEGLGGNEVVDRCCDRINEDAEKIKELCGSIKTELTNSVSNIAVPYAIGSCVDMPVHKILEFFKDIKIIVTFLKDLIRLGTDIISQLTILAKIVSNGFQSLAEILQTLKDLIGVDKIMNMIDFLVALFRPKMVDAKALLENSLSPIYYNETEDYEQRVIKIEELLDDDKEGGTIANFDETDNPYVRDGKNKTFGGKTGKDDDLEDWLEELEKKGENEISAYRSPILNDEGDDFAGWIYFHANVDSVFLGNNKKNAKNRRKNKLIRKASKKNKMRQGKLIGGVAQLRDNTRFGKENSEGKFVKNTVTDYEAFFWYIHWTNDPTDCVPDFSNLEYTEDENGNIIKNESFRRSIVTPVMTTENGSLVEVTDGGYTFRVFVKDHTVRSGDFVNVNGKKYRVK